MTTPEDTPVSITVNASDPDGEPLTFEFGTPEHGTITMDGGGTITYRPDDDYNGPDSIHVDISDGDVETSAEITITVTPVNDAPVAVDNTLAGSEDTPVVVTGATLAENDQDIEGDALTVTAVANPSVGTVGLVSDTITYTPPSNFTGTATYEYTVSDGELDDVGTVTITIGAQNDPPIAVADTLTTAEDTPGTITATMLVANDTDPEGQTLSVTGVGGATNGTVALAGGTVTFTPAANYNGAAVFTYTLSDGAATATGTVNVTVTPVNDTPVANAGTATVNEDGSVTITLTGSDVEGTSLTFAIATQPTVGTLGTITTVDATSATVVYTPNPGSGVDDSFTFTASDGTATSAPATVSIEVIGINDAPVANAGTATTDEDMSVPITLTGTDADVEDTLTFAIATGPTAGTLGTFTRIDATSGTVVYTPNANSDVNDSFTFTVNDGTVTSAPATVTITVNAINDTPVANAGAETVTEDTPRTITLSGSDVDSANLTFAIATPPAQGLLGSITQVTGTTASVTYSPALNSNVDTSFTFTVSDGNSTSAPATVTIDMVAANDPPVAVSRNLTTDEDTAIPVLLQCTDVENDPLTFEIVGSPLNGSLGAITPGAPGSATVVFTPTLNTNLQGGFQYRCDDGAAPSASAPVVINITPVDDPPVADPVAVSTDEDAPRVITLSGSDVEGGALTFSIVMPPTAGSLGSITQLTPTSASVTYTPNANSTTDDSFTYRATANSVSSAPATVTIDVVPVNDPPIAVDDTDTTATNQPLVRLASAYVTNDTDIDGGPLTITAVNPVGVNGTAALSSGTITFTPNTGFTGAASFDYTVSDGAGGTDTGTVNVTVFANTAPVANNDTDSTAEDTPMVRVASTYASNDIDPDPQTLTVTAVQNPSTGTVDLSNGTITFTPGANFSGAASFEYVVSDTVTTTVGTVNVTVTPVNDLPVAVDDTHVVDEDSGPATVNVLGNDTDVEGALTVTSFTPPPPAAGTVALDAGVLTFTPLGNFAGPTSFTYTVTDSDSATATATVNVTVTNLNDAPVANAATATTPEGITVTVNLTGSDIDSPTLTFAIATGPTNGTLSGITVVNPVTASVQYTPSGTFFGTDTFTFTVSDGSLTSTPATATITVTNRVICGDSLIETGEDCDDTNKRNGDGCSSACLEESGWDCGVAAPSVCNEICGDMIVVGDEECDDMDADETDGCTTSCVAGPTCTAVAITDGDAFTTDTATGHCYVSFNSDATTWAAASTACEGLGAESHLVTITSSGEQSLVHSIHSGVPWIGATDDGNDTDTVFNWVTGEAWGFTSFAGGEPDDDGGVDGNGECLAIVEADGDWGDTNCNFTGFVNGRICEIEPTCGNGVQDAGETCDDGNTTRSDGCSALCQIESGAVCSGTAPTTCAKLVINEIDYDQPGSDTTEFVEIRNNGTASADLTNIALVLINNSAATGTEYFFDGTSGATNVAKRIRLNTASVPSNLLPPGDMIIVGTSAVTSGLPSSVFRVTVTAPATGWIQNGGAGTPDDDSVMLFDVSGTGSVVDSILYEGTTATGAVQGFAGTFTMNEGTGIVSGDPSPTGGPVESLQRSPNGRDRQNNATDFSLLPSSPGAANP